MALHPWLRRNTRHFGEVWSPVADLALQAHGGQWINFRMDIDTGAVVTLLRRSAAELLGVDLVAGRPLLLASVGGHETQVYLHHFPCRIGPHELNPLPIAIADSESVPHLLGRLGFFDRLGVDLDPVFFDTWIRQPVLTPETIQDWQRVMKIYEKVARHANSHLKSSDVDQAVFRLFQEATRHIEKIELLLRFNVIAGVAVFVRILFELLVQIEFILKEENESAGRAKKLLDWEKVSNYRRITKVPGLLQYVSVEALDELKQSHDCVAQQFEKCNHWYPYRTFTELAKAADLEKQHQELYPLLSEYIHGDPSSPMGTQLSSHLGFVYPWTIRIMSRIAWRAGDHYKTELVEGERDILIQLMF